MTVLQVEKVNIWTLCGQRVLLHLATRAFAGLVAGVGPAVREEEATPPNSIVKAAAAAAATVSLMCQRFSVVLRDFVSTTVFKHTR